MSDYDESVLLLRSNYHGNGTGVHANETKQPLSVMQTVGRSRFRQLNVTEFPYKCGLVLFYHIPCTGERSTDVILMIVISHILYSVYSRRGIN
jgi:hypothetical protein